MFTLVVSRDVRARALGFALATISCGGHSNGIRARTAATSEAPDPAESAPNAPVRRELEDRRAKRCSMRCDGAGNFVRLQLEEGQDYHFTLMAKNVGPQDELHISTVNRDRQVLLVENSPLGATLSIVGEDALKVCSKVQLMDKGCAWACDADLETGVVKMSANGLSAELAVSCY